MSSLSLRHKRSAPREYPILQDINGDIATTLAHNGLMLTDDLVTDSVAAGDVKSCPVHLFQVTRGLYDEMPSDSDLNPKSVSSSQIT